MYRHIWAEIDLNALEHNFNNITKFIPKDKIMGVVKANAYGHGAGAITKFLSQNGVGFFAVSSVYEAIDLRENGIKEDILILGNIDFSATKELAKQNVSVCIFDTDYANKLNKTLEGTGYTLNCHIKLDTGMGRLGFDCRNGFDTKAFEQNIKTLFSLKSLNITGVFTHFASADGDGENAKEYTKSQYSRFKTASDIIKGIADDKGVKNLYFHSFNSSATLLEHQNYPTDLYRTGIILYGLSPSEKIKLPFELKPVMSLKAMIAQVKEVKKGDSISYGSTFTADKNMRVATVTAGYADGYMRGLSNCGYMLINGKKAKILGRVCMDQTVVDVTDIENVNSGDVATLFGEGLLVDELANLLDTINYELVCAVAHRVPRIYIKNNKEIDTIRYLSI